MRGRGRVLALAALGASLQVAGCASFEYRVLQTDFEAAVIADNRELDPVIDRSGELYADVVRSLSPERIASLDPKLRPNAWLLRAFSQWRRAAFAEARDSAARGVAAGPVAHTRDDVLLHLVPALVIDSETMQRWHEAGRETVVESYSSQLAPDFATALGQVDLAEERVGAATPHSTVYYLRYQRWRVLGNWREVISRLPHAESRAKAREDARIDGRSLKQAAAAARDAIPESYFLRQRMR